MGLRQLRVLERLQARFDQSTGPRPRLGLRRDPDETAASVRLSLNTGHLLLVELACHPPISATCGSAESDPRPSAGLKCLRALGFPATPRFADRSPLSYGDYPGYALRRGRTSKSSARPTNAPTSAPKDKKRPQSGADGEAGIDAGVIVTVVTTDPRASSVGATS